MDGYETELTRTNRADYDAEVSQYREMRCARCSRTMHLDGLVTTRRGGCYDEDGHPICWRCVVAAQKAQA